VRRTIAVVVVAVGCHHPETGSGTGGTPPPHAAHAGCLPRCDITTDEGVNAALVASGRQPQPKEEACITHDLDNRMAKFGDFADDRGCAYAEAFVGCCIDKIGDDGDDAIMLGDLGWATATPAERAKLAVDYLGAVYAVSGLTETTADFGAAGHPAFTPPASSALPDGGVRYTAWIQENEGSGMVRATSRTFTQEGYDLAADGKLTTTSLATFTVPIKYEDP
jgi:hypothetical protein